MPTTWTKINKASGTPWTKVSPQGLTLFDDSSVAFDSPLMLFDGNTTAWTKIAKPNTGIIVSTGSATGLLMPPTYSSQTVLGDIWTKINKPTL